MSFDFTNPEVAAKYVPCREKDGKVHIPAGKKVIGKPAPVGYAGPLSKITLEAAEKAIASGSNLLKAKDAGKANEKKDAGKTDDKVKS